MIKPIPVSVCPQQIRAVFKEQGILDNLDSQNVKTILKWQNKTNIPHLGMGAYSQIWEVLTLDGHRLAIYHQYTNSSGKRLGIPDPKYLIIGEVSFLAHGSSESH